MTGEPSGWAAGRDSLPRSKATRRPSYSATQSSSKAETLQAARRVLTCRLIRSRGVSHHDRARSREYPSWRMSIRRIAVTNRRQRKMTRATMRDVTKRIRTAAITSRDATVPPFTPIAIPMGRGWAEGNQARFRGRLGTNARKRRGLSTMIRCRTSSLAPAAFSFGTNTVNVFP